MSTLLPRWLPIALALALACLACSDRVVDSRAYNAEGQLQWSTVMPSSRNTAVWLRYSVSGPVHRPDQEAEGTLQYEFIGHLVVNADGAPVYQGAVYLKPDGIPLDRMYAKGVRKDVQRSCSYSSCIESGRLKLVQLHEVPAGAVLDIKGNFYLQNMGAEINSVSLELAPN
jgi:hypothetical protein